MPVTHSPAAMSLTENSPVFDILRAAMLGAELPLDPEIPWDRLLLAADYHGVLWTLAHAVSSAPIPSYVRELLDAATSALLQRQMLLTAQMLWIYESLQQKGMTAVPYKGPMLAAELYEDPMQRPFSDLDLLILPEQLPAARQELVRLGFRPEPEIDEALDPLLLRVESGQNFLDKQPIRIELVWSLAPYQFVFDSDISAMLRRTRTIRFQDTALPCLAPEDELFALAVHAAKHAWCRLMWLHDIHRFAQKYPDIDHAAVLHMAEKAGVRRLLLCTLEITRIIFGTPWPAPVQHAIAQDEPTAMTAILVAGSIAQRIQGEAEMEPSATWRHRILLGTRDSSSDRRKYLWRLLFTPSYRQLSLITLPRPFYFGYSALRGLEVVAKSCVALLPIRRSSHGHRTA